MPSCIIAWLFQSTLPLRGATHTERNGSLLTLFQSTLPLRGATATDFGQGKRTLDFNPHSPCGERLFVGGMDAKHDTISIHTPLAGSDPDSHTVTEAGSIFQSTLPLRGATEVPAVCGVGDFISIHTPLAGSDADCPDHAMAILFQSTLPLRGATNNLWYCQRLPYISIHTPLAGSDIYREGHRAELNEFQSTLPLRGATL